MLQRLGEAALVRFASAGRLAARAAGRHPHAAHRPQQQQQHPRQRPVAKAYTSAAAPPDGQRRQQQQQQQQQQPETRDPSSSSPHPYSLITLSLLIERLPLVIPADPKWRASYLSFSFDYRNAQRNPMLSSIEEPAREAVIKADREDGLEHAHVLAAERAAAKAIEEAASDPRSLLKHQSERLFLLLQDAQGGPWRLPSADLAEGPGDTVRAAAERASAAVGGRRFADPLPVREARGDQPLPGGRAGFEVFHVGNGPAGHVLEDGGDTLRLFCKAQIISGDVEETHGAHDYAWLSREQALERLPEGDARDMLEALMPLPYWSDDDGGE